MFGIFKRRPPIDQVSAIRSAITDALAHDDKAHVASLEELLRVEISARIGQTRIDRESAAGIRRESTDW